MEFSFGLMGFLVVFPLIVAAALLFVRQEGPRRVIVCVSALPSRWRRSFSWS